MLLALRSLFETTVIPPIVVPPVGGGGSVGVGHGQHPFQPLNPPRIGATVTLRPARFTARAGILTASGGAKITLHPVSVRFSVGKIEPTAGATIQMAAAKSKFQAVKLTATGIDNDPLIAIALLDL